MRRILPGVLAILAALAFGIWALPNLPDPMASHWGLDGKPDGWSSRTTTVFVLPLFGLFIAALLAFVPRIDPRRRSHEQHASTWWIVANASLMVISAIHVFVIGYGLGWNVRFNQVVAIGIGGLFVLIGNLMTRMRPNWFMGIRTPWTLSSDTVWRKTHRVGAYGFVAAGLAAILAGIVIPERAALVLIVSAAIVGVGTLLYSYFAWRQEAEESPREAR
jgi:uncharacterized membrane protein